MEEPAKSRPTRHRQQIIDALARWFRRRTESPTLEELCQELGMVPKQKATLQRWLQTIRGHDVEWDDYVPRSLRLVRPQPVEADPRLEVRKTLRLLATGLVRWSELRPEERAKLPQELRLGISFAAMVSMMEGVPFPETLPDFMTWAHQPLVGWPPARSLTTLSPEASLLHDGLVTDLARTWSVKGADIVAQIQEKIMEDVLFFCRARRMDEAYRSLRLLLITRPCIPYREYRRLMDDDTLLPVREYIRQMYMDLSDLATYDEFPRCPRCGYIRRRRPDGTFTCRDPFCERLAATGRYQSLESIPAAEAEQWKVVTPGIYYYVTLPGLWEVRLADTLADLGARVTLWPEIDEYDLLVQFPRGAKWAIDVKDWSDVHDSVTEIRPQYVADRTIVVFPDERRLPLHAVREEIEAEMGGVRLRLISEVVREAQNVVEGRKGRA